MNQLDHQTFLQSLSAQAQQARRPDSATIELTYGCNLRCVHCYNPTHRALPQELTTEEVRSILTQMADLGVLTVSLSGGEPSLRPDIEEILGHARRAGLLVSLLTNATRMTPAFAARLEELAVAQVFVSIYGATAETYDAMTGVPGSYASFLRGLDALRARAFPVTLRMPVTTINWKEVEGCRALAVVREFKFQYSLDIHPRTDRNLTPLRYRLAPEIKAEIDRGQSTTFLQPTDDDTCGTDQPFISCACGRSRFAVTPYGQMNLCAAFPIPGYDLRRGTVREGWEVLKQTVDLARPDEQDKCPTCEVGRFCRQGRSDAWLETGQMSPCLPHFKSWARAVETMHATLLDPRRSR